MKKKIYIVSTLTSNTVKDLKLSMLFETIEAANCYAEKLLKLFGVACITETNGEIVIDVTIKTL